MKWMLLSHRLDLTKQTVDLVNKINYSETKAMKKLFNYQLSSMREDHEMAKEVKASYLYEKGDEEVMRLKLKLSAELSYGMKIKKDKKRTYREAMQSLV